MPSADMAAQVSSHIIGCLRQQKVLAQALDSSLWCQPPRLKMIMLALLWSVNSSFARPCHAELPSSCSSTV